MGGRQYRPLHDLHRANQLDLRYHDVPDLVLRVRLQHQGKGSVVSIGMVYRRPAIANTDYPHDSHRADSVPAECGGGATDVTDTRGDGGRGVDSLFTAGRDADDAAGVAGTAFPAFARKLFPVAGRHIVELLCTNASREDVVH